MNEERIAGVVRLVLAALWSGVLAYVAMASLPDSPLRPSQVTRDALLALTPERWAFFTRDPREPVEHVHRREGDRWLAVDLRNASPVNWFGIRKYNRLIGMELITILEQVPADEWRDCAADVPACEAADPRPAYPVASVSRMALTCGEILVERRSPVPWAWSGAGERVWMPARYVRLQVRCDAKRTAEPSPRTAFES